MTSSFARLAELPLSVDGYALEGLARAWSPGFTRRSTVLRLRGRGHEGLGEDVTYTPADHERFQADGGSLPLAGRFTLATFSALLDELELSRTSRSALTRAAIAAGRSRALPWT